MLRSCHTSLIILAYSSMHPRPSIMTQSLLLFFIREVGGKPAVSFCIRSKTKRYTTWPCKQLSGDTETALSQPPQTHTTVSKTEQDDMRTLAAGTNINRCDAMRLTEECSCGKWFMAGALKGHVAGGCSNFENFYWL
ncbi:hypothetical protein BDR07DRAFT_1428982 [Suillus spraguei]|nr:hypothetical protein BDR07DRAFT_1428982 [Suillus spraguei]